MRLRFRTKDKQYSRVNFTLALPMFTCRQIKKIMLREFATKFKKTCMKHFLLIGHNFVDPLLGTFVRACHRNGYKKKL